MEVAERLGFTRFRFGDEEARYTMLFKTSALPTSLPAEAFEDEEQFEQWLARERASRVRSSAAAATDKRAASPHTEESGAKRAHTHQHRPSSPAEPSSPGDGGAADA